MDGKDLKLLGSKLAHSSPTFARIASNDLRLPQRVSEMLGGKAAEVERRLTAFNQNNNANLMTPQTGPAVTPSAPVRRTLCRPVFTDGDRPLNFMRLIDPQTMSSTDLDQLR